MVFRRNNIKENSSLLDIAWHSSPDIFTSLNMKGLTERTMLVKKQYRAVMSISQKGVTLKEKGIKSCYLENYLTKGRDFTKAARDIKVIYNIFEHFLLSSTCNLNPYMLAAYQFHFVERFCIWQQCVKESSNLHVPFLFM